MFNFQPTTGEVYKGKLHEDEAKRRQIEAWIRTGIAIGSIHVDKQQLTQSLINYPTNAQLQFNLSSQHHSLSNEIVHSVQVLTNNSGHYQIQAAPSGGPSKSVIYDPNNKIRLCYICKDPYCPNVEFLESGDLANRACGACNQGHETNKSSPKLVKRCVNKASQTRKLPFNTKRNSYFQRSAARFSHRYSSQQKLPLKRTSKQGKQRGNDWSPVHRSSRHSFVRNNRVAIRSANGSLTSSCDQSERSSFLRHRDHPSYYAPSLIEASLSSGPTLDNHSTSVSDVRYSSDLTIDDVSDTADKQDYQCNCRNYHSHKFTIEQLYTTSLIMTRKKNRLDLLNSYDRDDCDQFSQLSSSHCSEKDNHVNICNTFWRAQLTFSQYRHGDVTVDFTSLWPSELVLRRLVTEAFQGTILRKATLDLCKLAIRCGPVRLLKALIELKIISVDQVFDDGSGMLHMACIARNFDAVLYLCNTGISPRIRDKFGHTADQVCFCPRLRKLLPPRYVINPPASSGRSVSIKPLLVPSLQDNDSIFTSAKLSRNFDEVQKKLQTFDFAINQQSDSRGDYLIHLAARGGVAQLPFLMSLMKIQETRVELTNGKGMTALMIASQNNDIILVDVLMCVFGSNPNMPNSHTGQCALHYACLGNHAAVVNCLIKRGADFNLEDNEGCRPDDTHMLDIMDECCEIIHAERAKRCDCLTTLVESGEVFAADVRVTDLYVTEKKGRTLLMVAAEHNRLENLETLLDIEGAPVNGQHGTSGETALSVAARHAHADAVKLLLNHHASPNISDVHGYLPLHYAVMNSALTVVDALLEGFPNAYVGLPLALKLCKKSSTHVKIKAAITRRQDQIITYELYDCALTGDAERLYRVLETGDNVNPKRGVAPIYLAVENSHLDVIKLLYENGGDIRKRHPTTQATILHAAARMGHTEIIEFLLNLCRQPNSKSKGRITFRNAEKSLDSYYRELDINVLDGENKTALQVAAEKGYIRIVKLLLNHGATTSLLNKNGELVTCSEFDGVRICIENYRDLHTRLIMKTILDRKGLPYLKQIWLSPFDHNLRDKNGDTPLMVACKASRLEVVKYLLESSVYENKLAEDTASDDSDVDSGVGGASASRATTSQYSPKDSRDIDSEEDENAIYAEIRDVNINRHAPAKQDHTDQGPSNYDQNLNPFTATEDDTNPFAGDDDDDNDNAKVNDQRGYVEDEMHDRIKAELPDDGEAPSRFALNKLLQDISQPRGLFIYQGSIVCHVSAVNLFDGSTSLHRTIEGGDNPAIISALLEFDAACINVQNTLGYSALHLACKLSRKKSLEKLLEQSGIDVYSRTAEGKDAEELVTNRAIKKLLEKAKQDNPQSDIIPVSLPSSTPLTSSHADTTIDLDKIGNKYNALKRDMIHNGK